MILADFYFPALNFLGNPGLLLDIRQTNRKEMTCLEHIDIIQRCQQGEPEAFEELYRRYARQALKTAYLIFGRKELAEDIVQEAFIQCFRKIKDLKNTATFQAWFYRILTRIGWRLAAKQRQMLSFGEMDDNVGANRMDMDGLAEANEERERVKQAIERLKPPLKTVIVLFYYNDLSVKEIAEVTGCFQGTVKSRLHTAKKLLEAELQDYYAEGLPFTNHRRECNSNV